MEHVSYIASALCINDTLQTLHLDNSPFGVKGATAFAEMLRINHSLVELNIGQCNSDGAHLLANALCMNNTLRKLHLKNNPIGLKRATIFAEMLKTNLTPHAAPLFSSTLDNVTLTQMEHVS